MNRRDLFKSAAVAAAGVVGIKPAKTITVANVMKARRLLGRKTYTASYLCHTLDAVNAVPAIGDPLTKGSPFIAQEIGFSPPLGPDRLWKVTVTYQKQAG